MIFTIVLGCKIQKPEFWGTLACIAVSSTTAVLYVHIIWASTHFRTINLVLISFFFVIVFVRCFCETTNRELRIFERFRNVDCCTSSNGCLRCFKRKKAKSLQTHIDFLNYINLHSIMILHRNQLYNFHRFTNLLCWSSFEVPTNECWVEKILLKSFAETDWTIQQNLTQIVQIRIDALKMAKLVFPPQMKRNGKKHIRIHILSMFLFHTIFWHCMHQMHTAKSTYEF